MDNLFNDLVKSMEAAIGALENDDILTVTTTAKVLKLPQCDYCSSNAKYDAQTKRGHWAYMCNSHFNQHARTKKLGLGLGQELKVSSSCNGHQETDSEYETRVEKLQGQQCNCGEVTQ